MSTPFLSAVDRLGREAAQIEHDTSIMLRNLAQEKSRLSVRRQQAREEYNTVVQQHMVALQQAWERFNDQLLTIDTDELDLEAKLIHQSDLRRCPVTYFSTADQAPAQIDAQPEAPPAPVASLPETPPFIEPERNVDGASTLASVFSKGRRGQRGAKQAEPIF